MMSPDFILEIERVVSCTKMLVEDKADAGVIGADPSTARRRRAD